MSNFVINDILYNDVFETGTTCGPSSGTPLMSSLTKQVSLEKI